MTRRNAFRQCDLERALRAAQATKAGRVVVRPDGAIEITPLASPEDVHKPVAAAPKVDDYVL